MQRKVLLAGVCLVLVLCCVAAVAQFGNVDIGSVISPKGKATTGMMTGGPQPTPVMQLDSANQRLFILSGDKLYMYSTVELKLLEETRLGARNRPRPPSPD